MKRVLLTVAFAILGCGFSSGQAFRVLYNFGAQPGDGSYPASRLLSDSAGNIYGTTENGGNSNVKCLNAEGCGTVYELTRNSNGSWSESVLYAFCSNYVGGVCLDGAVPASELIIDSLGNLYGTTEEGGSQSACGNPGCGTVFQLSPPSSPGGAWSETVLYSFCSVGQQHCTDGFEPAGPVTLDSLGNLYGTALLGGWERGGLGIEGNGLVFELSPSSAGWHQTVLYTFCAGSGFGQPCPDGAQPTGALTSDTSGNLYGTTPVGGSTTFAGGGTVYELSPGVGGWTFKVLHAFQGGFDPVGGGSPRSGVVLDSSGNFYGTAIYGGQDGGYGVLFRLNPSGAENQFSFDGTDGNGPFSPVTLDERRHEVFGTTAGGGADNEGTVFKIDSSGQETVLYSFCSEKGCVDGYIPFGGVIESKSGNLYGTVLGGALGNGLVYEITP
jgi:uncharacterized repeat protein (TIGR03803 family)